VKRAPPLRCDERVVTSKVVIAGIVCAGVHRPRRERCRGAYCRIDEDLGDEDALMIGCPAKHGRR